MMYSSLRRFFSSCQIKRCDSIMINIDEQVENVDAN
jgi:hypothetical protein